MPSYLTLHKRVYRGRGKASAQRCITCPEPTRDWAQVHDTDGTNIWAHYMPMCRRCHFRYDRVTERTADKLRGRPQRPEVVEARRKALRGVLRSDNKSGVPGVHWHTQAGKWRVQFKRQHCGLFSSLADAVEARNEKALELFGPDAKVYPLPTRED